MDQLAATVDVETLDDWLDRSADYDKALRDLYAALRKSDGRVDAAVRRAVTAERKARMASRRTRAGLVVIMSDIGRGGMNGAVIAIEQARGEMADASPNPRPVRRPDRVTARSTRSGEDAMPAPVSGRYTAATYR